MSDFFVKLGQRVPEPEASWLSDWYEFHSTQSLKHRILQWLQEPYLVYGEVTEESGGGIGTVYVLKCPCGATHRAADYECW
jgi:hypothetical protein